MDALGYWFNNKNFKKWFKRYQKEVDYLKAVEFFEKQFQQNKANELLFTPVMVIDDRIYPAIYMIETT